MRLLLQIGLVFSICLAGEFLASLLPIPFPGSVLSMLIVFILLVTKVLHPKHVEKKLDFMLQNMAFFFIPPTIAIVAYFDVFRSSFIQIIIICLVSTFLTFTATAFTVRAVMALQKKHKEKVDNHG